MKNRKCRIDTSTVATTLTDTPLAALAERLPDISTQELGRGATPECPELPASGVVAECPRCTVERTRKGGYPVFVEKRTHHQVTVIRNVAGDADGLLRVMKKQLGAGGVIRDGAIELQGEHRESVIRLLTALCLDRQG